MNRIRTLSKVILALSVICLGSFMVLNFLAIEGTAVIVLPLLFISLALIALGNFLSVKGKLADLMISKGERLFTAGWTTSALILGLVFSWQLFVGTDVVGWVVVITAFVWLINLCLLLAYGVVTRKVLRR